ncbi:MAG TPA: AMP-binding protein, partial [Gammaproteobacteria bacterium]|nr:AMP-binding protein [Gammaproteobacteria bacterium]
MTEATADTGAWDTLAPLFEALAAGGEREALVGLQARDVRRWCYREVAEAVERLAAGLQAEGVAPGSVVVLYAPPSPEAVVAALATVRAGALIAPLDVQFEPETVTTLLRESGAGLAFTTETLWQGLGDGAEGVRPVRLDLEDEAGWRGWLREPAASFPEPGPDDQAALFFTSGTTGTPKGVPLSHRNLAFQMATVRRTGVAREGDRVLLPLPVHHVYPFVLGLLAPLSLQLAIIFPFSVTGPQLVRALRDERTSLVIGVPRLYGALLDGIEGRFGRLAPVFRALLQASSLWRRRFGGLPGRWLFAPLHKRFGGALRLLAS